MPTKSGDLIDWADIVFVMETFLMPFMKWLGANGPIDAMRAVDVVNAVSLQFFDAYLREGPKPRFDAREFPELRVTMNAAAGKQPDSQ